MLELIETMSYTGSVMFPWFLFGFVIHCVISTIAAPIYVINALGKGDLFAIIGIPLVVFLQDSLLVYLWRLAQY